MSKMANSESHLKHFEDTDTTSQVDVSATTTTLSHNAIPQPAQALSSSELQPEHVEDQPALNRHDISGDFGYYNPSEENLELPHCEHSFDDSLRSVLTTPTFAEVASNNDERFHTESQSRTGANLLHQPNYTPGASNHYRQWLLGRVMALDNLDNNSNNANNQLAFNLENQDDFPQLAGSIRCSTPLSQSNVTSWSLNTPNSLLQTRRFSMNSQHSQATDSGNFTFGGTFEKSKQVVPNSTFNFENLRIKKEREQAQVIKVLEDALHSDVIANVDTDENLIRLPNLWHYRLCHIGEPVLSFMASRPQFNYLDPPRRRCFACKQFSQLRADFAQQKDPNGTIVLKPRASKPLELVHADLAGPYEESLVCGSRYMLVLVDDYSRYTFTYFLKSRDCKEIDEAFGKFINRHQTKNRPIFQVKTYQDLEPFAMVIKNTFKMNGIVHQQFKKKDDLGKVNPVFAMITMLRECTKTLLRTAFLPHGFWTKATAYSRHTLNRVVNLDLCHDATDHKTIPFERFYDNIGAPDLTYMRTFGCLVRIFYSQAYSQACERGVFLGYSTDNDNRNNPKARFFYLIWCNNEIKRYHSEPRTRLYFRDLEFPSIFVQPNMTFADESTAAYGDEPNTVKIESKEEIDAVKCKPNILIPSAITSINTSTTLIAIKPKANWGDKPAQEDNSAKSSARKLVQESKLDASVSQPEVSLQSMPTRPELPTISEPTEREQQLLAIIQHQQSKECKLIEMTEKMIKDLTAMLALLKQ